MRTFDAIVIGLGGMGSAALYHLARRGLSVLGIEQFAVGHGLGSSHGDTRIIRKAYFEHPDYVPLLHRTFDMWRELEALSGKRLFVPSGLLLVGPEEGVVIPGVERAARTHGLGVSRSAHSEWSRRFPGFRFPDNHVSLWEPDAGFLFVEQAVRAHAELARNRGAELLEGEPVRRWAVQDGGVVVETSQGRFVGERLALCAGAWAAGLLTDLGLPLTVRRKIVLWFEPADGTYALSAGCPVFGVETPEGFFYGFPALNADGVKIGDHTAGDLVGRADDLDRRVSPSDETRIRRFATDCLPALSPVVRRRGVCMYTMTPDEHFVIDRHPRWMNVAFAAGFSGHGFKFAPVVGAALADLLIDGTTALPIGFLGAARAALRGGPPAPPAP
ncbi:MAG: N-methyl-L-tryptophan oxidase [Planctomycetes bacterium]|nr:N-methyl-L-tryptophan oxidase [Planctomycetota bacterium]